MERRGGAYTYLQPRQDVLQRDVRLARELVVHGRVPLVERAPRAVLQTQSNPLEREEQTERRWERYTSEGR